MGPVRLWLRLLAAQVPVPARGLAGDPRVRPRLAYLSSRPTAFSLRRVRIRRFRGVLPAPRYCSYRFCGALGLPLACMLHNPAHPMVASDLVEVSLPGCRACGRRDRAFYFIWGLFLADIPGSAASKARADA